MIILGKPSCFNFWIPARLPAGLRYGGLDISIREETLVLTSGERIPST
jgi:hypothetical protein